MTRILLWAARMAAVVALFAPPALAFEVTGLAHPQSFIVDEATGKYYISNVQGRPASKDNHAFITLLDADGNVETLKLVEGGKNGVTLHAPKGIAIAGNTLYVADIDCVRGFDKATGAPVADIDLSPMKAKYLNDVAIGPDGKIFASDTVGGQIFLINPAKGNAVEVFATGKALDSPNGMVFGKKRNKLFVTLGRGMVGALDMAGKLEILATLPARGLVGLDMDVDGTLFVSSFTRGHLYKLGADYKPVLLTHGLVGPMNISLDKKKRLILVPLFLKHRAFTIEY
ncbi:MAG: hypothetical protein HZA04_07685, partial [Nitrospinae bacterium]|nr:hypothetical protein [Nitrospinota bacterium]